MNRPLNCKGSGMFMYCVHQNISTLSCLIPRDISDVPVRASTTKVFFQALKIKNFTASLVFQIVPSLFSRRIPYITHLEVWTGCNQNILMSREFDFFNPQANFTKLTIFRDLLTMH